ncbi:MAG: hypothetical protein HY275_18675 [Gemmatimonadetes bacterium]|nr:hypothetical protein [Gemmatimonadota bacterium]
MILGLLSIGITVAAGIVGHTMSREYTASRLKFVDAVQKPSAAWFAGLAAFGVGMLLTPLPLITAATAITFGAGVGTGVASGARRARGYLPPG